LLSCPFGNVTVGAADIALVAPQRNLRQRGKARGAAEAPNLARAPLRTAEDEWLPKILDWNRNLDPAGRYEAAMAAQDLFEVTPLR
jgi:hypothetical protein